MQGNMQNNGLLRLVAFFAIFFTMQIFSMIPSPSQREMGRRAIKAYMQPKKQPEQQMSEKQQQKELAEAFMPDAELEEERRKQELQQKKQYMGITEQGKIAAANLLKKIDAYFIYALDTNDGIWIKKKTAEANSDYIKKQAQYNKSNQIGLPFSIDQIRVAFDVLRNKVNVHNLSLKELTNAAIVFDFLGVSPDQMNIVLTDVKKDIEKDINESNINEVLKELPSHLQKILIMDSTTNYLKDFIIKTYTQDRKKILIDYGCTITAIACTPDNKKMVSAEWSDRNRLILWDVSNPDAITQKILEGHQGIVNSIAFSSNGRQFISGSEGNQNNLFLWSMDDLDHPIPLVGHPGDVKAVAFSQDGKYIAAGGESNQGQDNLTVWDVTNTSNFIHQVLSGHPTHQHAGGVATVQFSPNSEYLISGSEDDQDNLILWSMNNWGVDNPDMVITSQRLDGHPDMVLEALFSSDGKKILSVSYASTWYSKPPSNNSILLWDISDQNNITYKYKWLDDHSCCFKSAAFSPDDKSIVSVCMHNKNVMLWDVRDFNNITSKELAGHSHGVFCAAFSPDNKRIISGGECGEYLTGNNLILWNVNDKSKITHQVLKGHPYYVIRVNFTPDGKRMISGGKGRYNNLILWTLLTDEEEASLNRLKIIRQIKYD